MENEIPQVGFFNCKLFDENSSLSLNYQNLPFIMSTLNMESMETDSPKTVNIQFQSPQSKIPKGDDLLSKLHLHQGETNKDFTSTLSSSSSSTCSSAASDDDTIEEPTNFSSIINKNTEIPSSSSGRFRGLRPRNSDSLMRINRRTIERPKKIVKDKLTPSAVKKLYMDSGKKLGRFKPANLETIFEEPLVEAKTNEEMKLLGKKKLKRSLSCSDGLNVTKATIRRRRQKIKRIFGRRFVGLKKICLADFKEKLNSSMEDWEDYDP